MKQTWLIMGMPIRLEIIDAKAKPADFTFIKNYFHIVDRRYSTYKVNSEISKINRGLPKDQWSQEMKQVLALCEKTKVETDGFFDIAKNGELDPSGLVKGWAIQNAAGYLKKFGYKNFYIDAGGDVQVVGRNKDKQPWRVGIRSPFNRRENIKIVSLTNRGIATSGTYIRGAHVYNPNNSYRPANQLVAISVIGPDIYNADRFATAAFAMGLSGLNFIESLEGYEAYAVDHNRIATMTSGFERYVLPA